MTGNRVGDGAVIIPLWQRRMALRHPLVDELKAYWSGCREGDLLPRRAAIDPRAFKDVLSYSFITERVRPGVVRFRLAGTHLSELMGMEVRGMPLRAFFELSDRPRLMEFVEAVFAAPAILDCDIVSDGADRVPLEGRLSLMPLRDSGGAVTRALGCLITDGIVGAPPRRFRLRGTQLVPVAPGSRMTMAAPPAAPGFAESPGTPYRDVPDRADGRPVLTVLSGGKAH